MKLLITGVGGLVGSESASFFRKRGWAIIGVDNNSRETFFGNEGSVLENIRSLQDEYPFEWHCCDISDLSSLSEVFRQHKFDAIIHAAAQPSHDKAASIPLLDFNVNALGTLNLLELTRQHCPEAPFIFTSTNKVYGDQPNHIYYDEEETRFTPSDPWYSAGFNEELSIDQCTHSLFGCSKAAADLYCQEYGKYFGLKTCILRLGCITGSRHKGAKLHGFLNYLARCILTDTEYEIIGYGGKQVRDQIHAQDLAEAFDLIIKSPVFGEVFNLGGGLGSNCSVVEAIAILERLTGRSLKTKYNPAARIGDHQWYVSDISKFQRFYQWTPKHNVESILQEIISNV